MKKNKKASSHENNLPENIIRALAKSEEYKMKGENLKALHLSQKILEKDPSCMQAAEEVADNLLSLGKDEEAKKAAKFAYKLNEKSYIANYILGFTGLDNDPKSQKYLQTANKLQPNNPEILRCLGWSLFHSGASIEGIVTLDRALNLSPQDPLILCDLGVCLLHENKYKKAMKLFAKALSLEPNNPRAIQCYEAAKSIGETLESEKIKFPVDLQKLM